MIIRVNIKPRRIITESTAGTDVVLAKAHQIEFLFILYISPWNKFGRYVQVQIFLAPLNIIWKEERCNIFVFPLQNVHAGIVIIQRQNACPAQIFKIRIIQIITVTEMQRNRALCGKNFFANIDP